MKTTNKGSFGSLLTYAPIIIGGIVVYYLVNSGFFKSIGSLVGNVAEGADNVVKGGGAGGAAAIDSADAQVKAMTDAARGKIVPTALNIATANQLYQLVNTNNLHIGDTILPNATQAEIWNVLRNNRVLSVAGVVLAYGTRTVNNRQSAVLGFIWDETTGTLRDHLSRYMSGTYKTESLKHVDSAIRTYLQN